jgi:hypothetical protein
MAASALDREHYVFANREMRYDCAFLVHERYARRVRVTRIRKSRQLAVTSDGAAISAARYFSHDDFSESAFARAVGTHQSDDLTGGDIKADIIQSTGGTELNGDAVEF